MNIIFAIAIYITYALQCYVPVDIIWSTYMKKKYENSDHRLVIEYTMRAGVVLVTCKLNFLLKLSANKQYFLPLTNGWQTAF